MAELDGAIVEAAAPAVEALELLLRPLVALGKRLEAVLEDAPDWLDVQARARIEGAIGGLAWRTQSLAAWLALAARSAEHTSALQKLMRCSSAGHLSTIRPKNELS